MVGSGGVVRYNSQRGAKRWRLVWAFGWNDSGSTSGGSTPALEARCNIDSDVGRARMCVCPRSLRDRVTRPFAFTNARKEGFH